MQVADPEQISMSNSVRGSSRAALRTPTRVADEISTALAPQAARLAPGGSPDPRRDGSGARLCW
jgi:hypothetical protein